MKARTLVLMLSLLVVGFTGFGNTTPDLTDNSTAEMLQGDLEISVNVVAVPSLEVDLFDSYRMESVLSSLDSEAGTEITFLSLVSLQNAEALPDEDVGWQFGNINYNYRQPTQHPNIRTPRDGLKC